MPVPIFESKVLSYGPLDLGPNQRFYKESVWEEKYEWVPGEWLGEVEINEASGRDPADKKKKTFIARFRFNDGTNIAVTGDLPSPDNSNWLGVGEAWAQGQNRQGSITVEGRNPKRWG